jgi:hypothetical protein
VILTETNLVPVAKEVIVEVVKDGVKFAEKRTVLVTEAAKVMRTFELSKVKATDGTGTAIAADKLAELLKETTPVVLVSGPVAEKHRALFKEKTVFIEPAPLPLEKLPVPPAKAPSEKVPEPPVKP